MPLAPTALFSIKRRIHAGTQMTDVHYHPYPSSDRLKWQGYPGLKVSPS